MAFTQWPKDWLGFVYDRIGEERYDALRRKALAGVNQKMDWAAEVTRLRAVLRELEAVA